MLTGKTALVTGASRGIGKAIAIALAAQGAAVVINYSGSEDAARAVQSAIEEKGGIASVYKCNVGDFNQVKEMIENVIQHFGQLDILVNNAGITKDNLLLGMTEEEFDKVIEVNLKGTFNTIKHASRHMLRKRSGRIINISSVVGVIGNPGQVNYSASKAGVIGITKAVAKELAKKGVTCNAIAPGFISTDMTDALNDNVRGAIMEQIPMKKFGEPQDIAEMVLYLASDRGEYITGQVFQVNGGMAM